MSTTTTPGGPMDIATIRARARRWADIDARVPFRDERLFRMNGTNPTGRRPHSFEPPQLLRPANDNVEEASDAA